MAKQVASPAAFIRDISGISVVKRPDGALIFTCSPGGETFGIALSDATTLADIKAFCQQILVSLPQAVQDSLLAAYPALGVA